MMATGTPISTPSFELWSEPGDGDAEVVGSLVVLCVVDIEEKGDEFDVDVVSTAADEAEEIDDAEDLDDAEVEVKAEVVVDGD